MSKQEEISNFKDERERELFRRYANLVKYANDMIFLLDHNLNIIDFNDRTLSSYGYSSEELLSLSMKNIRYIERETTDEQFELVEEKDGLVFEDVHQRKDSTTFAVESSVKFIESDGKGYYLLYNRDITHRKERELRSFIRNELLKLFVQKTSRKKYLDAVVQLFRDFTSCCCVAVRILDRDGTIQYEANVGFSQEFWRSENLVSVKDDNCVCTRVILGLKEEHELSCLTKSGSFVCNNTADFLAKLPESKPDIYRGVFMRSDFKSLALIPIKYRDKVIGLVQLIDLREGKFTVETVDFIEKMCPVIGEAIHRFNLEEELKRNYDLQAVSNSLLSYSLQENSLEEVLQQALNLLLDIDWLNFESKGSIYLVSDKNNDLVMKASTGLEESILHNDAVGLPAKEEPECGHYCIPILSSGNLLGVINLYLKTGYQCNCGLEKFLSSVANTLALIIKRKQAEKGLRESEELFRTLVNSMDDIIFTLDNNQNYVGVYGNGIRRSGIDPDQIIGKTPMDVYDLKSAEIHMSANQSVLTGKSLAYEWSADTPGGIKYYQTFLSPMKNDEKITGLVGVTREITEVKRIVNALRESEAGLAKAQRIARVGNWEWDIENDKIYWSDEIYHMLNMKTGEFGGNFESLMDFIHQDDRDEFKKSIEIALNENKRSCIDYRIITPGGVIRAVYGQGEVIFNERGKPVRMFGIVQDITERKKNEEKLHMARQQLLDIIEFLPFATFVVDGRKTVIAWNKAMEELTGVSNAEVFGKDDYAEHLFGYSRPLLTDLIFCEDKETEALYEFIERKGNTLYAESHVNFIKKSTEIVMWASASPLFDNAGNLVGAIETIRDITERRNMEKELKYLASHDFLTGIHNRYSLEKCLEQAVKKVAEGVKSALLFIDLDNFKLVNDTLGHAAGDQLLKTLSATIGSFLQGGHRIFRFGGDEFAVLLENVTVEEAGMTAENLRLLIEEHEFCLTMYKTCFNMTISIGIVIIDGILDFHKILAYADNSLYKAKEGGRNRVVFAQAGDDVTARMSETNHKIALIKTALKEDRFILYLQPVVRMKDGKITHHETLIRMLGDNGEIISPNYFLTVAERFGLIAQIDRWVVQAAMKLLMEYPDLKLFINLSGVSMGDMSLLDAIEKDIIGSNLDTSRIGFEITETSAMRDIRQAEEWIGRIKKLGCSFALDDFGVGFSSFSYLKILPVDYLKIDGTFVCDIYKDSTHAALVSSMNTIARTLGKKTIAEFVENQQIINMLIEIGVEYGQGFYLAEPSPVPATGWIKKDVEI
ncbi:diguanylate cyclase/phosphodiesterase with PAS/PAC and GAF sensor(s) [Desulfofarcimen acetoxidans DSM 771]|uniref:Diguanylate cyclase/phosphodiesterase with PAS/PAC and GAF sensor(S) n=1 Tax=Desulfofarcimen acetoxidans (strain ATCC 49208 / DSM 771 / KCTC 5769 / VKM B-1644 / 5575) TaxID=485916 RepID=C8W213_DESAS|nr:EAL domain-containing protein [Desulfofarcimen acetoxidans]ACV61677.1 diguanylate cyclase/phosphodiesterase with PAS/PAC and GAF sensor(s) [Desulfofarcimen acetoxidans DSM 771]